ncbi:Cthe_2314 family HEPN domain-containing protein [Rhodophyticola porphyridii]|nr:Cthe_2314 family HEPN domain-containing protein [Rhodophyticola porphyridii]
MSSDDHELIGRIFDLGIVELNFETYEELSQFVDCRYVFHCGMSMRSLVRRVESLNLAGDLIWVDPSDWDTGRQAVDRYAWLNVACDVFLMRLISVFDCVLLFANDVFESGLEARQCTVRGLKKRGVRTELIELLEALQDDHEALRYERNSRIHQGWERTHSSCDETFRMAASFERNGQDLRGADSLGKRINSKRYMKEGLVELQRDHNISLRKLGKRLNEIYDLLSPEFEDRFRAKFRDPDAGFGYRTGLVTSE